MLIWFKKVSSVKKLSISNSESFLESIFEKYCLQKMQTTAYTKPLNMEL